MKDKIIEYFKQKNEGKLINKNNFTTALRRLISRLFEDSRQEIEPNSELKLYITRYDLWKKELIENESFEVEIDQICIDDIKIGHSFDLFNILDGDMILNNEINEHINQEKGKIHKYIKCDNIKETDETEEKEEEEIYDKAEE